MITRRLFFSRTATGLGIPAVVDVVSPMGPNTLVYVLVDGASIVADVSSRKVISCSPAHRAAAARSSAIAR